MGTDQRVSDELLIYLGELALEFGKKQDRWKRFSEDQEIHGFSLTRQQFSEIDSVVAPFVKYWSFYFTDIPADFLSRTYNCPYAMIFDSKKQEREWYLMQVENGVVPNGPTFGSYLREFVEGRNDQPVNAIRLGPAPRGMMSPPSMKKFQELTGFENQSSPDTSFKTENKPAFEFIFASTKTWSVVIVAVMLIWIFSNSSEEAITTEKNTAISSKDQLEQCIQNLTSTCGSDPIFTYCSLNYASNEIIGSGCTGRVKRQGEYTRQVEFCEKESFSSAKKICAIELYGCFAVTGSRNC